MIRKKVSHDCLLLTGKKRPRAANCADLVVTSWFLQCCAGVWCRKWAHYCTSTPTAALFPPSITPTPLLTTCAGLTGWTPLTPKAFFPPQHKLLYSCTSLPNHILNVLCCFTLHCFNNISEDLVYCKLSPSASEHSLKDWAPPKLIFF